MPKALLISGSARINGNTQKITEELINGEEVEVVELLKLNIGYYTYSQQQQDDDFWEVILKMQRANSIIFATPVYWYSMSALMKTFFDRFTELITVRKDLGHSLKNKHVYLVTSSSSNKQPDGFEVPFRGICKYFGMNYKGSLHTWTKDGKIPEVLRDSIIKFKKKIFDRLRDQDNSLARQNNRMIY